jgi:hypothetical protein
MKHLLPVLALLALWTTPAMAGVAPRPCTEADLSGVYSAHGYGFISASDGKVPDLSEDEKDGTLVGFFNDFPKIKYPYGSLKKYGLSVNLVVGTNRRVTCASLAPYRDEGTPEMNPQRKAFLETVSDWRFLPFKLDGEAVPVAAEIIVFEEEMPARHVDMPAGDPAQMTLSYDRHADRYGPSYHVELHGDGTAVFMTTDENDPLGPQVYHVDPKAVQGLLADAQAADFWSLRDLYREAPGDFPSNFNRISFTVAGVTKSVTLHEISDAGAPQDLGMLSQKIEKAANVDFWQEPTLATVDRLKVSGFDFTSERAGRLLLDWAGGYGIADEVPLALMQLGAPLRAKPYDRDDHPDLLETALGRGRVEMARRLIAAGLLLDKDGKPDPDKVNRDFLAAIDSGDVAAIDLIAPFHPDMVAAAKWGHSPEKVSVLFRVHEIMAYPRPDLVPIAQRLVEMGADVKARDASGTTLLMYVNEAAYVAFLLDHGVEINAVTEEGSTALAATRDQDIALLLLARGADPRLGQTPLGLRLRIKHERWHRVKAWLESHGHADLLAPQPGDDEAPYF